MEDSKFSSRSSCLIDTSKVPSSVLLFYLKLINELVYQIRTPASILHEDHKIYQDDIQYLRRSYKNQTLEGKPEISDRIRIISNYYDDKLMLMSEIPFMFITKSKDIFLKRYKRLKKLKKKDESQRSQNQTSSFGTGSLTFSFEEDYLKELKIDLSQLMNSQETSFTFNDQIDSETHNVYGDDFQEFSDFSQIKLKFKRQDSYQNLICDFQEVDIQSAISFYKDLCKSKHGSAIMSEIIQEQHKFSTGNSQKIKQKRSNKQKHQVPLRTLRMVGKNKNQSVFSSYVSIFRPKGRLNKKTRALNGLIVTATVQAWTNMSNSTQEITLTQSRTHSNRLLQKDTSSSKIAKKQERKLSDYCKKSRNSLFIRTQDDKYRFLITFPLVLVLIVYDVVIIILKNQSSRKAIHTTIIAGKISNDHQFFQFFLPFWILNQFNQTNNLFSINLL